MMELTNDPNIKLVKLNRSQGLIHLINANVTYCTWPRASGKTSGGIGPRILRLSEMMPRSQTLLIADSFERIGKVLLPAIENYLNEELGMIRDVDYVIHKRPPDHWTKPLFIPAKYDHTITFSSGFTLCEVSLEVSGSANGYNAQAVIGDEVKYFDEKKFKSEVRPAIRGGKKLFGHLPEFQSMWFFTDKFPSKGANVTWVLNKRAEVNQQSVDIIYALQLEVLRLQTLKEQAKSASAMYNIQRKIDNYEERMRRRRMDLVYYSDALPYENQETLGEKYFRDLRRDLTDYEYKIAIENRDPDTSDRPFYPDLNALHWYKSTQDRNPNKPLIIGCDYQFSISPVVVTQFDRLKDSAYTTLNFIKSLHTVHPKGLAAAVKKFCEEFADQADKHVYYVFDQTAIGRSPHGKTFRDIVVETLYENDWNVTEVYTGDVPDHDVKYERLKYWLNCQTDKAIRLNEVTNPFLKKSLEKSSAMIVNGKTKKDKSSEKENSRVDPAEATHYSDTFDQIVWAACELDLIPMNSEYSGMDIRVGKR